MRYLIVTLSVLLLSAGLAPNANADVSDPGRMVEDLTIEFLAEVIREIGGQDVQITDGEEEGTKVITFVDRDVPYNVSLALCKKAEPHVCRGFGLLVLMEDTGYSNEILNKLNRETMLVTLFKDAPKQIGVARVELTVGGVTKKHVAEMIVWFVIDFHDMLNIVNSQITAEGPGGAAQLKGGVPLAVRPIRPTAHEIARMSKRVSRPYEEQRGLPK
jgi:hypothetical protein